ncbi:MAG TPA: SpoIIE family protein phosphatase [candidate division Zixibacteria bacterium]|nr:SpoIIE family protein phosphatase [candidate division Zixibacteria bacterium]
MDGITTNTSVTCRELERELEITRNQLADLATMGAAITSVLDLNTVLPLVMDMAVRLVQGEVGLIMLEKNGELTMEVAWGVDETFARSLKYVDQQDLPTYCHANKEIVVLNEVGIVDDNGTRINEIICLPIRTQKASLGVIMIINKRGEGGFTVADRSGLEMLLDFLAVAIDNSRLMKERLKQQKIKQEMAIAGQIQETILPRGFEKLPGLEIGAAYFPAREVGGDFYDVIKIAERQYLVVIGDVSNKGVPAALIMSAASGIIKSTLYHRPDISVSDLAATLNDLLVREIVREREMFATLFFAKFDFEQGYLDFCNAGHLPGLFWDSQDRTVVQLAEGGPIVGQFEGLKFVQGRRPLRPGDRLFLFTDGLTEAEDSDGNLFGRERAEQVFVVEGMLAPKEFCLRVKEWVDKFQEGSTEDSHDDFTILLTKVE